MQANYVKIESFILATRDSGYKNTASAFAELVDNSLDAGATEIHITLEQINKEYTAKVIDNGAGMTANQLHTALLFGGSSKFNSRESLGRYGMGLGNSSLSQARRFEVITWKNRNKAYSHYLDVDELVESGENEAKQPIKCNHPSYSKFESGTLVAWEKCDRISYTYLKNNEKHIHNELGRIFRYPLFDGTKITLNGVPIQPFDPLFIKDGANIKGGIPFGEPLSYSIRVPGKKRKISLVSVRFVELPVEEWSQLSNEKKSQLKLTKRAGMSVIRKNRELDYGWFLISKRMSNYDDWWRCELTFDPELDELFGVTHTKQELRETEDLLAILSEDLGNIARKLNARVKEKFIELKENNFGAAAKRQAEKLDHFIEPPALRTRPVRIVTPGFVTKEVIKGATYYLYVKPLDTDSFYELSYNKTEIHITLNSKHEFYNQIYNKLITNPNNELNAIKKQIEILIFAVARAESKAVNGEQQILTREFIADWSKILATFLGTQS